MFFVAGKCALAFLCVGNVSAERRLLLFPAADLMPMVLSNF